MQALRIQKQMPHERYITHFQKLARTFLILGLGGVLLAGCSATPEETVDESLKAELLSLVQTPPELGVAQQYEETRCLRQAGFEVPLSLTVPPPASSDNLSGIYGLMTSVEEAERHGYSSSLTVPEAPIEKYRASLSSSNAADMDAVQFGDESVIATYSLPGGGEATTTTEGCFGAAVSAVYGSPTNYLQLSTIRNVMSSQFSPGSSLPPGLDQYRECMKESGYVTTGLNETLEIALREFGGSRPLGSSPTEEEAKLAGADAACQLEAGFLEYYNDAFIRGASVWINQNESWILGANEAKNLALVNAKQILESGSAD